MLSECDVQDWLADVNGRVPPIFGRKERASQVREAGAKMREITHEIRRVTDIMDEITAASQERPGQPGRHADGRSHTAERGAR